MGGRGGSSGFKTNSASSGADKSSAPKSMAQLKGSEKQIAWAEDIRNTVVNTLEEVYNTFVNDARFNPNDARHTAVAERYKKQIQLARTEDRAWFFIETFRILRKSDSLIERSREIQASIKVSADAKGWM